MKGAFFILISMKEEKICKKCGRKFIEDKGPRVYCSYTCSNTRSHTKESKEKIRKSVITTLKEKQLGPIRYYCKSCSKEVIRKKFVAPKYCKECWGKQSIKLYKRLGIYDQNLCICNKKSLEKLIDLLFIKQKNYIEVSVEFNISVDNIRSFFKKNNLVLEYTWNGPTLHLIQGGEKFSKIYKYHRGEHITWKGNLVHYRSSYEKRIMCLLDSIKEEYFVEYLRIRYILNGKKRTYISDFYLPHSNIILEAKGEGFSDELKQEIESKKLACLKLGYRYCLVYEKDIKKLEEQRNLNCLNIIDSLQA